MLRRSKHSKVEVVTPRGEGEGGGGGEEEEGGGGGGEEEKKKKKKKKKKLGWFGHGNE
jgi:hypothetical protein